MITAVLHGFFLALGLILPLGVQNVFIFNQGAVQSRFRQVLPGVVTASICDTLLVTLAVLGVSVVVLGTWWIRILLLCVGICFLIYMGWNTWRAVPQNQTSDIPNVVSLPKQIAFSASVSLLNPHAILDTIGVIGTSSLSYHGSEKWAFTLACVTVSWIWFVGLAFAGRIVGKLDSNGRFLRILNKFSACVMWVAAVYMMRLLVMG